MQASEFLDQVTFIDVGAYDGGSLRRYLKMGGSVRQAHLFEPNPHVEVKTDFACPVTVHRKAAWVEDGHCLLYLSRLYQMEGSTLFAMKTTGDIDREHPIEVECIDFAAWICNTEDRPLVLKLNAEGAEYGLINELAEADVLNTIDVIYLSLHADKIGLPEDTDDGLRELLSMAGFEPLASHVYDPRYFEAYRRSR